MLLFTYSSAKHLCWIGSQCNCISPADSKTRTKNLLRVCGETGNKYNWDFYFEKVKSSNVSWYVALFDKKKTNKSNIEISIIRAQNTVWDNMQLLYKRHPILAAILPHINTQMSKYWYPRKNDIQTLYFLLKS